MAQTQTLGTLFLVVGPSGVGKDSVMDGLKLALSDTLIAPRRFITRPDGAGGEDHLTLTEGEFARFLACERFFLHWNAHGLRYGIASETRKLLEQGHSVMLNVSRSVISDAEAKWPRTAVISIRTSPEVLKARLSARGRETEDDIEERLERAGAFKVQARDLLEVENSGSLDACVATVLSFIQPRLGRASE